VKFGIFSNGLRRNMVAAVTYESDLQEIVAADRLGFEEAWVSEHFGGWLPDTVPNAELLIAKAAGLTRRIKLGPAVRLLPLYHPLDVAASAAMCDHMLRGRYLFGVGSGVPFVRNMERRGMTNDMRHPMMMESIEFILKSWTATEPFDWDGAYWRGTGISLLPKPYQQPYPPIAVATSHENVTRLAAERGWTLLISQFAAPDAVRERAEAYAAASPQGQGGRSMITVARQIYVTDSVRKAREELRADVGDSIEQWKRVNPERFDGFLGPGARLEDFDYDRAFDSGLFIGGDPDTVARQLIEFHERCGGFGTLLLVMGKDWGSARNRLRSMRLFMSEVAPRLAALGVS